MIFEFALYVFLLFIGGSFILFLYWTYALLHTMRGFYKKSVHAKNDIYGYRFFCKMDRTIPSRREIGRGSSLKVSLVFIRASLFMFSIESHLQGNHIIGILCRLHTNYWKWTKRPLRFRIACIFCFNLLRVFCRHKNLPFGRSQPSFSQSLFKSNQLSKREAQEGPIRTYYGQAEGHTKFYFACITCPPSVNGQSPS